MADLMQEAREAARRACLVLDDHQQEVVSIPVKDWATITELLRATPAGPTTHYHSADGIHGTLSRLRRYAQQGDNKSSLQGQTMEEAAAFIEWALTAQRSVPDWTINPTPEMLEAGRTAVMAARVASKKWTPRQHYEASGRSMAGIPEDVLDEHGPLTKESVAVMVFGSMVANRPGVNHG